MAKVARGHGGDGGDRPPHGVARSVPSGYQSSQAKNVNVDVRGKWRNLNLYDEYEKNKCRPLDLTIDISGGTYRFIGDNGQIFVRLISNLVGSQVPLPCHIWRRVPTKYKDDLYPELEVSGHKLVGTPLSGFGGYQNVERAKRYPPPDWTAEVWNDMIDLLFLTEEYKHLLVKNKVTRSKLLHTSAHGCRSYAQRCHLEEKMGIKPQHIEDWRQMRYKEDSGYCTTRAKEDWEKIQEEYEKMQNEIGEVGEVNEEECLERAIGRRRSHARGVGRQPTANFGLIPNERPSTSKSSQSQPQSQSQFDAQQIQEYLQQYHALLATCIPNFQPSPVPNLLFNYVTPKI